MRRPVLVVSIVLALCSACACGKSGSTGTGTGTGTGGGGGGGESADCEKTRAHVTDLYRAEAADKDPKLVDQMIADNTAMVMAECSREPGRVAGCAAKAATSAELESKCLLPLDEEGSEGDRFKPR